MPNNPVLNVELDKAQGPFSTSTCHRNALKELNRNFDSLMLVIRFGVHIQTRKLENTQSRSSRTDILAAEFC